MISIHLMLRFIPYLLAVDTFLSNISIHLMLRFISAVRTPKESGIVISIHLMLRFILYYSGLVDMKATFQYISCYGLSGVVLLIMGLLLYFNTSHVTVYQL